MDCNVVVVSGRIAAPPEIRECESGSKLLRYVVTATSDFPRHRIDVLPIVLWDPPETLVRAPGAPGMGIFVIGGVQRRFCEATEGRRARLELVAHQVRLRPPLEDEAVA